MSAVELQQVAKRFGNVSVVQGVSLAVEQGELLALLGPSGSGKTTLLRLIAGFENVDAGRIIIAGNDVTQVGALARRCGMVFQHYALFPHLTVGENVAYGLADQNLSRAAVDARVGEVLALVDLPGLAGRPITALSGGQQQRVALARALAPRPALLLLDEPLSNLDPTLRERTRRELRELVRRVGITTIIVTHEQEEAFDLADRIALLLDGRLAQVASPEELYAAPASPAVLRFIGRSSAILGTVVGHDGPRLIVEALGARWLADGDGDLTGSVSLFLRPEAWQITSTGTINGEIAARRFAGAITYLDVRVGEHHFEVAAPAWAGRIGDAVTLAPAGGAAHAWPAAT
jgi:ABC-type Fe3+/spermidine/putrescine transport system ATPase subunit